MDTFTSDVSRFVSKAGRNADALFRQTCQEAAIRIIMGTPVDTGYARGGWWAALDGSHSGARPADLDPTGAAAVGAAGMTAAQARAGQVFTLGNGVAYIDKLEYGWSKQAPAGMVRIAAAQMPMIVEDIARRLGI